MPTNANGDGVYTTELSTHPEQAMERVAESAEAWGGEWQYQGPLAGKLILPVRAGVRRGWMGFEVAAAGSESGSRLELRTAQEHLNVDKATVAVLLTALFGALLLLVVPFVPRLLPLVPAGFVLTMAGWFFVVARLRNSGPTEFLELICSTEVDTP